MMSYEKICCCVVAVAILVIILVIVTRKKKPTPPTPTPPPKASEGYSAGCPNCMQSKPTVKYVKYDRSGKPLTSNGVPIESMPENYTDEYTANIPLKEADPLFMSAPPVSSPFVGFMVDDGMNTTQSWQGVADV